LDGELSRAGAKRVFLITTGSIARNPAVLGPIESAIGGRLVGKTADIGQHAPVREVARAAREAREMKADALVSAGGGSPIDAAKAVAWSLASGIDLAEPDALQRARGVRLAGKPVLPHFAVPTTLSVAELSGSAGFSAEGTNEKVGVAASELVPKAVFYDAALAVHTPLELWLSTGIRAVDHAVETLLAPGEHPLPDAAALEGLRLLAMGLRQVKADPQLKTIPVVVLTSSREEQDLLRTYDLGVNAYVVKPVDFREFIDAVKALGGFWAVVNEPPPAEAAIG